MQAFIFTSKRRLFIFFLIISALTLPHSYAQESKAVTPDTSEEEDYEGTPFTEYGEFNEDEDETQIQQFFQYGRFFGFSLGTGFYGVTGNRGLLWEGGFPMTNLKVHYWFDFELGLDLGFHTSPHSYESGGSIFNVSVISFNVNLKYYFNTKDVTAPITFASPYLILGGGGYFKSEASENSETVDSDSNFGINAGFALEFPIVYKKSYFTLEGKVHFVTFADTFVSDFQPTIPDLTGMFYSLSANVMFTW